MNWYLEVLRKYAVFSGRARRMEYWMFLLINVIIALVLGIIDGLLGPRCARRLLSVQPCRVLTFPLLLE